MTIIHIVTSFMPGGAEMLVCDLANRQAETHRVHLLILHGKGDEALLQQLDSRISVHRLHRTPRSLSPRYILRLHRLMQQLRPDVLHYHLHRNRLLIHYPARHIITVHGMPGSRSVLTHLALKLADKVVGISTAVCQSLKKQYRLHHTAMIHNGIHTEQLTPARHIHYPLKLVNVARLDPTDKAQDILIRAIHLLRLREHPLHCELDLLGDGAGRPMLEALVQQLGLQHVVHFRGQLPRQEIYRRLSGYDIMVHPSRSEGFGLAVAEGMAAGLPVLVSDCPALAEVIRQGELGELFTTDSPESCADAIEYMAGHPEETRHKAADAREYAAGHYSVRAMADAYERLYLSV